MARNTNETVVTRLESQESVISVSSSFMKPHLMLKDFHLPRIQFTTTLSYQGRMLKHLEELSQSLDNLEVSKFTGTVGENQIAYGKSFNELSGSSTFYVSESH